MDEADTNLLRQALTEIDRYRSMDRLIPSYHNVVTIATLEFYLTLSMASLIPHEPRIFFPLTRYAVSSLEDVISHTDRAY